MVTKEAIKQLCDQASRKVTVDSLKELLDSAGIRSTMMGYYAWGKFTNSQLLFVIDGKGYIARRAKREQSSPVIFNYTLDGKRHLAGNRLTENEIKVFSELGL